MIAALVAVVAIGLTVTAFARLHERTAPDAAAAATSASAGAQTPSASGGTVGTARCLGAAALAVRACHGEGPGIDVTPAASAVAADTALQYDCFTPAYAVLTTCHYGSSASGATRVALVGDDRGAALLPGLLAALQPTGWSLTTYIGDGCVLGGGTGTGTGAAASGRCSGAQATIDAALGRRGAFRLVVVADSRSEPVTPAQSGAMVERIRAAGGTVAQVRDLPQPSDAAIACSLSPTATQTRCTTGRTSALAGALPALAHTASIDLTDDLCTAVSCAAVVGDVRVVRDSGAGLTTTFSRTLGPFLVDRLAAVLARSGR